MLRVPVREHFEKIKMPLKTGRCEEFWQRRNCKKITPLSSAFRALFSRRSGGVFHVYDGSLEENEGVIRSLLSNMEMH